MTKRTVIIESAILVFLLTGVLLSLNSRSKSFPITPEPYPFSLNSRGLLGRYFISTGRRSPYPLERIDVTIDFNQPDQPLGPGTNHSDYAVTWTGRYLIERTGEYRFTIVSTDGVRLWLDDVLRIDGWERKGAGEENCLITMGQGWHGIRLDSRRFNNNSIIRLMWSTPDGQRTVIPADHLMPMNSGPITLPPLVNPSKSVHAWFIGIAMGLVLWGIIRFCGMKRFAAMTVGVVAGLVLWEVTLHWLPTDYVDQVRRKEYLQRRDIIQFLYGERHPDPEISYVYLPNVQGTFTNEEFSTHVRFNRLGFRGPDFSTTPDPHRRRMLVIGDSLAFGWGVEENETFVELMNQAHPDWEVLNLSISGFSTRQEWAMLRYYGPRLHPQDVIIAFYPNDVPDCMGSFGPFSRWEGGFHPAHFQKKKRLYLPGFLEHYQFRSASIDRYWRHTDPRQVAMCGNFFLLMREWCHKNHVNLHVLYIPYRDELAEKTPVGDHIEMPKFWTQHQIDWVDATSDILRLKDPNKAYFRVDEHMTPLGHAVVAKTLLDHLHQ